MTSASSDRPRSQAELAIKVGEEIHAEVMEEGRREGVHAYLFHDGQGHAWFEKFDRRTKELHRRFSPELAAKIRRHKEDLRIYARSLEAQTSEPAEDEEMST